MHRYAFALTLLLLGCTATGPTETTAPSPDKEPKQEEASLSDRIYFFQHRLLPSWVFNSEGEFFFDVYNRNLARFTSTVEELINTEYADGISVSPLTDRDAVLIIFPEPKAPAHCFYALIKRDGSEFAYYTYEKSLPLWEDKVVGAAGGWNEEGEHMNFGPRSYQSAEAFVEDILGGDTAPE